MNKTKSEKPKKPIPYYRPNGVGMTVADMYSPDNEFTVGGDAMYDVKAYEAAHPMAPYPKEVEQPKPKHFGWFYKD